MRETTTVSDTPEIDQMTEPLIEITAGAHTMVVANAALRVMVFALLAPEEDHRNSLVDDLPAAVAAAISCYSQPAQTCMREGRRSRRNGAVSELEVLHIGQDAGQK
jgi:hypothetical protein